MKLMGKSATDCGCVGKVYVCVCLLVQASAGLPIQDKTGQNRTGKDWQGVSESLCLPLQLWELKPSAHSSQFRWNNTALKMHEISHVCIWRAETRTHRLAGWHTRRCYWLTDFIRQCTVNGPFFLQACKHAGHVSLTCASVCTHCTWEIRKWTPM